MEQTPRQEQGGKAKGSPWASRRNGRRYLCLGTFRNEATQNPFSKIFHFV